MADIYGVNQTQGPALNMSQSSALSGMYGMNPELLLDRVGAGVAQVTLSHALLGDVATQNRWLLDSKLHHLSSTDCLQFLICWLHFV